MKRNDLTVSTAMAAYNGAEFLLEQLDSIAGQSRLPLELVVCDDNSADDTVDIVERFAATAPFNVRLVQNPVRLGFVENFMRAARLCSGDLIAWCDQDDVWIPEKIARCVTEFERDSDVVFVVHSRQIGDRRRHGHPVIRGGPRAQERRFARRRRVFTPASLPMECGIRWIPGFASIIDRRVLEAADALGVPVPAEFGEPFGHDTWTAFVAGALGKTVFLPDVLTYYRQHGGNSFGAPASPTATSAVQQALARQTVELQTVLEGEIERASSRAGLLDRVPRSSGGGRAIMWQRRANAIRRRSNFYRNPPSARLLFCSARRGDYRSRNWGGLGFRSLLRDLYRVVK